MVTQLGTPRPKHMNTDVTGTIDTIQGEVTVIRAGIEVAVSEGMPLYEGDIIKTGESGNIEIIYIDETVVVLGDNGYMVINEVSYEQEKFDINIDSGMFRFQTGEIAKLENDDIIIRTPAVNIGVRGTTLVGIVDLEGVSTFILVKDANGDIGTIVLSNEFWTLTLNQFGQTSQVLHHFNVLQDPYFLTEWSINKEFFKVLL